MLTFVLVCVSLPLFVSDCFSVSKLFRLPQVVSRFWKFFSGCLSCVEWFRFLIGKLSFFEFFMLFSVVLSVILFQVVVCMLTRLLQVPVFIYVFQTSPASSACVLLVVSMYFGSSRMVFSSIQVV